MSTDSLQFYPEDFSTEGGETFPADVEANPHMLMHPMHIWMNKLLVQRRLTSTQEVIMLTPLQAEKGSYLGMKLSTSGIEIGTPAGKIPFTLDAFQEYLERQRPKEFPKGTGEVKSSIALNYVNQLKRVFYDSVHKGYRTSIYENIDNSIHSQIGDVHNAAVDYGLWVSSELRSALFNHSGRLANKTVVPLTLVPSYAALTEMFVRLMDNTQYAGVNPARHFRKRVYDQTNKGIQQIITRETRGADLFSGMDTQLGREIQNQLEDSNIEGLKLPHPSDIRFVVKICAAEIANAGSRGGRENWYTRAQERIIAYHQALNQLNFGGRSFPQRGGPEYSNELGSLIDNSTYLGLRALYDSVRFPTYLEKYNQFYEFTLARRKTAGIRRGELVEMPEENPTALGVIFEAIAAARRRRPITDPEHELPALYAFMLGAEDRVRGKIEKALRTTSTVAILNPLDVMFVGRSTELHDIMRTILTGEQPTEKLLEELEKLIEVIEGRDASELLQKLKNKGLAKPEFVLNGVKNFLSSDKPEVVSMAGEPLKQILKFLDR